MSDNNVMLSKSLYTRGLQCGKSLWLKKKNKSVLTPPDASSETIFETGNKVGKLACELFPNGIEIPYEGTTFDEKISLTQKYLKDGIKDIYEATFKYNNILIMVDILHVNDDGKLEMYEVKSSTNVKEVYLDDASIQYYVLNGLGYEVAANIIHINNKYVREDELEIDKLFNISNITLEVVEKQSNIPSYLKNFETILLNENEPDKDIGTHCSKPYDCDAIDYCWKHVPSYSIFDIANLRTKKKFELYNQDIIDFSDISDITKFSLPQQIQIESELSQQEIINKEAISDFIDTLTYPLYHLDFETFQQSIPQWRGISPYIQIPFQFSLHIEQEKGSLDHKEFLAIEGVDPRYELARRLVEDIPTDVTVLAYNMGFEKGVIRKLANMFGEFTYELMAIHDNIKDLMIPFQKKNYYVPSMKGSYSIKHVLPSLVPEMAKAYKELDGVQNGGDAMQTYARLAFMEDKEEVKRLRNSLLEYCKLDTLAMVKILDKLKECTR
jgi:hypothetical protein